MWQCQVQDHSVNDIEDGDMTQLKRSYIILSQEFAADKYLSEDRGLLKQYSLSLI